MKASRRLSLSLIIALFLPLTVLAQDNYPRLANYYLSFFNRQQYAALARWDLLILQPDQVYYQAPFFAYYRNAKPDGKLLAYAYPAFVYRQSVFYDYWGWRWRLETTIQTNNWWLRDAKGEVVAAWPGLAVVNLTNPAWRDFNLNYLNQVFKINQAWDGVFYDVVDAKASLYNQSGIDINGDGRFESAGQVDRKWQAAMSQWLGESRQLWPDKLIIINGNSLAAYQPSINGRMFEIFPTPWEGTGRWADSMRQYLSRLPALNRAPNLYVINSAYNQKDQRNFYEQMRFGLTSTLLGDGYFSFDGGVNSHAELWWFDEYNVKLGQPQGPAVNLLAPASGEITAGLWRRDFDKGIVLVNSTNEPQSLFLPVGRFKYLRGVQEPLVNSGQPVGKLTLCPGQGIILLRQSVDQPILFGTYLMSYDESASQRPFTWRERLTAALNKLKIWFKYYGQTNNN
jgi:hypothetical protein